MPFAGRSLPPYRFFPAPSAADLQDRMGRNKPLLNSNSATLVKPVIPSVCSSAMPPRFDSTSPAALAAFIGTRVVATSEGRGWKDVLAQVFDQPHQQGPVLIPAVAEAVVSWTVVGAATVQERENGGDWRAYDVRAGDFYLTHSDAPYELQWQADPAQPFLALHVYVSPARLESAAHAVWPGHQGDVRLRDVSCSRDEVISSLLEIIRHELMSASRGSIMLMDGLLSILAVHLVRHYGQPGDARTQRGLPAAKLRKAILFMDEHLEDAFDLARIAQEVGLSASHFSRQFAAAGGMAPSRYFIARRVERARQLLRESDLSIVEVALAVGYSNPSHFAQVFRRETGVAPMDYRRA